MGTAMKEVKIPTDGRNLGRLLKVIRREKNHNQHEAAERIGVHVQTYRAYEAGSYPGEEKLEAVKAYILAEG